MQRQRPSPDGPSPGLEPFYTAASALPELAKAGATSPADGVSAADMDAAFAEEPDSPPKDTYLRGRGSAASQPEEGRGTAEGRGLEAGQQLRSHADSGHISISSPFQEGPRTPLTPRANSGGSGILSRWASGVLTRAMQALACGEACGSHVATVCEVAWVVWSRCAESSLLMGSRPRAVAASCR